MILKEIFIIIMDLAGIVSLIAIIFIWYKFRQYEKKVDLLSNIILNPKNEKLWAGDVILYT